MANRPAVLLGFSIMIPGLKLADARRIRGLVSCAGRPLTRTKLTS